MKDARLRVILLGGFLGAGKTTALLRLARHYAGAGKRVGIIANDQAEGLVDGEMFRAAGFLAEEVAGGCFCCRFDDLIAAAGRLADGRAPDVILAEPVGSCTDLVATVIEPLKRLYAERFTVAPFVALLDPERARQALMGTGPQAFSAKVTYIFKMQQHEADVVAVNKIDTLSPTEREELLEVVKRHFPKAEVIAVSARTGEGFDRLIELLGSGAAESQAVDVDYDVYAEGEAQLGWLNGQIELQANEAFDADAVLIDLLTTLQKRLLTRGVEPAHVKATLQSKDVMAVANLVRSGGEPELSRPGGCSLTRGRLLINARVETTPELLREQVVGTLGEVSARRQVSYRVAAMDSFAPGRPVPTHRFAGAE
jgi:G3E family GTPase